MPPSSRPLTVGTLLRHQLGAFFATVVDFGVMIALVELARLPPMWATAASATSGALTNFTLGRRWIFQDHAGTVGGQAIRYAAVSAGSLALNTVGEGITNGLLGVRYVLARILVAGFVSVFYNFPLHRLFVFPRRTS